MASQPYIVIRLVPESPVDGATFATYLDGLALQALDAHTGEPRSDLAYSSPLILIDWPGVAKRLSIVSVPTSASTDYQSANNYGSSLKFNSTDGISVGSYVFSSDQTTIGPGSNLQVTEVTESTVQLNNPLTKYVAAGTVVSFLGQSSSGDPATAPVFSFSLATNSPATTIDGQPPTASDPLIVLHFADVSGVTVGMPVAGSSITSGTTVAEVNPKTTPPSVIVSQALAGSPSSVTFTLNRPFAHFSLIPSSGTPVAHPTTLKFPANQTDGVAVGMTLAPVTGLIAPGTKVTKITSTTVVLSKQFLGAIAIRPGHHVYLPVELGDRSAR